MRYAYCIYFTITITIITCIAITIIIMLYFRKNFGYFVRPYLVAIYGQFGGQKTKLNDDERRRNQMVAKQAFISFE